MIKDNVFLKKLLFCSVLFIHSTYALEDFYKADLTAEEAYKMQQDQDVLLIDIRTPAEYKLDHAKGAILIPVFFEQNGERVFNDDFIDQVYLALDKDMDKKVLLICRSGSRTKFAANFLGKEGFTNVYNISHGFRTSAHNDDWSDINLPIEK
jgi:rhodanese-related sulfurtransferase